MNQTRTKSMVETVVTVFSGFVISCVITAVVFPLYGYPVVLLDNIQITCIFTIASLIRAYVVRRIFNAQGN